MELSYQPKVTVVIPVYNGADYVKFAIESALKQTYPNLEILVINDGSPDNSEEVIRPYTDRVRYFKKENGGVSSVLNMAIREMSGEWLSWLSHDDMYLPDKVLRQIEVLNEQLKKEPAVSPDKYILSCGDRRVDENGTVIPRERTPHHTYTDGYDLAAKELCNYTIGGCTVLAPKSAYEKMGGFDEKNRTISDADMWFRLMLAGYRFLFTEEALVEARYHKGMVSIQRSALVEQEKDAFYQKTVAAIKDKVSDERLAEIAVNMEKMGLKSAREEALSAYKGKRGALRLKLLKAGVYRRIKGALRTLYRKWKWR